MFTGNGQGGKSSYSNHSEEAPALTGFLQASAKNNRKESNQEIITYQFFTVMRSCFALQG